MRRKVALVTGAGKGIGKSIALKLAEAGYDLAINYYESKDEAQKVAQAIMEIGRKAITIQADVKSLPDIERMYDEFSQEYDRLDLLVNNAGVSKKMPFLETTPQHYDQIMDTNLKGVYFCSQAAARMMVNDQITGAIINISSNHAAGCWPDSSVYATAKAGVNKLTMNMALELSAYGIRVAGVAPGYTLLDWYGGDDLEERVNRTSQRIPMGRYADPGEIGDAVVYLASEKAAYITGTTLNMDGGALLPVVADHRFYS